MGGGGGLRGLGLSRSSVLFTLLSEGYEEAGGHSNEGKLA